MSVRRYCQVALGLSLASLPPVIAAGAVFDPITGAILIRAGANPSQTKPVVIGAVSLSDNTFPNGFDFATASLVAEIPHQSLFTFAGAASSSTNATAPAGERRASAAVNFSQRFTAAAPQAWLELAARVLKPVGGLKPFARLRISQPDMAGSLFITDDTAGNETIWQSLISAGTFELSGAIDTSISSPGSVAGALSGRLLIASWGDFNSDATVDAGDLPTLAGGFGSTAGTFASGNLDGDSDTDGADFLLFQRQYGTQAPAGATSIPVPEPAAVALMLFAFACGVMQFRCQRD